MSELSLSVWHGFAIGAGFDSKGQGDAQFSLVPLEMHGSSATAPLNLTLSPELMFSTKTWVDFKGRLGLAFCPDKSARGYCLLGVYGHVQKSIPHKNVKFGGGIDIWTSSLTGMPGLNIELTHDSSDKSLAAFFNIRGVYD